jgi:hypothetical protein
MIFDLTSGPEIIKKNSEKLKITLPIRIYEF